MRVLPRGSQNVWMKDYEEEEDDQCTTNRARRSGERSPQVDNCLSSIKVKMPPFCAKNNVDALLEWEQKVEMIFNCHNYSEEKNEKLAAFEFSGYTLVWWNELGKNRRRNREPPIVT